MSAPLGIEFGHQSFQFLSDRGDKEIPNGVGLGIVNMYMMGTRP